MRRIAIGVALLMAYVAIGSFLHFVVFPEPLPDPDDLPRRGTVVANPGIRSKFVYRSTSIETAGELFEWDNFIDPGGGPIAIPHVHPHLRETFEVVDGELRFVLDGKERIAVAGTTVVAEPGTAHAFENVSDRPAHMISRFEPATAGPWRELAEQGLLPDSAFVQIERAGGLGRVGAIQMLVIGGRIEQGHPPGLPAWAWDVISDLIAPTARLFGVHAYYPPPQ